MKSAIHTYFDKVTGENHIQEFFSDCETVEDAAECIADAYPLPKELKIEDVVEYIQPWWDES